MYLENNSEEAKFGYAKYCVLLFSQKAAELRV